MSHDEQVIVHTWTALREAIGVTGGAVAKWRKDPEWSFTLPIDVGAVRRWRAKHRGSPPPVEVARRGGVSKRDRSTPPLKIAPSSESAGPSGSSPAGAVGDQAALPLDGDPTTLAEADLALKVRRAKKLKLEHDILASKYTLSESVVATLKEIVELFTTELEQSVQRLPAECEGRDAASIAKIIDRFVQGVRDRLEAVVRAGVK